MISTKTGLAKPFLLVIVVSAALAVGVACGGKSEASPLFFAAASLADVLTDAADVYESKTGNSVEFNFGGSTALANQVARLDAPADGVILAGQKPLDLLLDRDLVSATDVIVIARNSLVVVSGDDITLNSLSDLISSNASIAIADPDLAPAGQYAQDALISAAAWDDLEEQIIPTLDVRAALTAVSSGSADFAIIYATDALTEPGLHLALAVEASLHQPVIYPAAASSNSSVGEATNEFLDFLSSPDGQQIFRSHGFSSN